MRIRGHIFGPSSLEAEDHILRLDRALADLFAVFEPNWFINDFDGLVVASTHGSPWRYDTYVPIVFAGHELPARRVGRQVHTIDVAPTLAAYLSIKPPSGSVGVPLIEVLAN